MPKRIPIKPLRDLGETYGLKHAILMAWDGAREHVVTWGKTVTDCDQAAQGGNNIKRLLGWPAQKCQDEPARVRAQREGWAKVAAALTLVRKRIYQRSVRTGCDTEDNLLADWELDAVDNALASIPVRYRASVVDLEVLKQRPWTAAETELAQIKAEACAKCGFDGMSAMCPSCGERIGRALAPKWQPMAEAPRDGSRILLHTEWAPDHEAVSVGWWDGQKWTVPEPEVDVVAVQWQPLPYPKPVIQNVASAWNPSVPR